MKADVLWYYAMVVVCFCSFVSYFVAFLLLLLANDSYFKPRSFSFNRILKIGRNHPPHHGRSDATRARGSFFLATNGARKDATDGAIGRACHPPHPSSLPARRSSPTWRALAPSRPPSSPRPAKTEEVWVSRPLAWWRKAHNITHHILIHTVPILSCLSVFSCYNNTYAINCVFMFSPSPCKNGFLPILLTVIYLDFTQSQT